MRYIVVCAGENHFKELYEKKDDAFMISVDGGYNYIREMNIFKFAYPRGPRTDTLQVPEGWLYK